MKLTSDLFQTEQYVEMVLAYLRLDSSASDYMFKEYALDGIIEQSITKFASEFIAWRIRLNYTPTEKTVVTDDKWRYISRFCYHIGRNLIGGTDLMSILEVSRLRKVYSTRFGGNKVEALKNVNFNVEAGEYVTIMGESGSGKTTLLNILAALDKPHRRHRHSGREKPQGC